MNFHGRGQSVYVQWQGGVNMSCMQLPPVSDDMPFYGKVFTSMSTANNYDMQPLNTSITLKPCKQPMTLCTGLLYGWQHCGLIDINVTVDTGTMPHAEIS